MSLVDWMSKKQPTIEEYVFGADFVVLKHVMEALRDICCNLRMMGVPLSCCSYVYGDSMSVIHNTQRPGLTLRNKLTSICYHAVREYMAMGYTNTAHISTHDNVSDLLTKVVYVAKRKKFVNGIFNGIYDFFCMVEST